jgi:hypothetical protein
MISRLQQLRNRREKLISLNNTRHYTQTDHPKILKYYRVLLWNNKLINAIEQRNVRPAKALVGLTAKDLRQLTENLN